MLLGSNAQFKTARAMYGYRTAIEYRGVVFESEGRDDMGTHIWASGAALAGIAQRIGGIDTLTGIIDKVIPARIDLAVDTDTAFVSKFAKLAKHGKLRTRAKSWSVINSQDNGQTVYIGSRSSNQFLRVYNKASEQGMNGMEWTRIELESKSDAAIAAKGVILAHNIPFATQSLIRGFCDCDLPDWKRAFIAEPVYVTSPHRATQTREWLLGVVATAMRRLIEAGDDTLFEDFVHKVFPE